VALALQFVCGLIIMAYMPHFRHSTGAYMLLGTSVPCQIYFLWVFGTRRTWPGLFRFCVRRKGRCQGCIPEKEQRRCCIGHVSEGAPSEGNTASLSAPERLLLHAMLQSPEQADEDIASHSAGMGRLLLSPGIVALGLVLGGPLASLIAFIANQACKEAYNNI